MIIPVIHRAPRSPHAAAENRRLCDSHGVVCLNMIGPLGCGKTALLEAVLPRLQSELGVGVIMGGLASARDAQRLAELGVPVVQVLTDGRCHLGPEQVRHALRELPLDKLDLLVIENVGGLACQAEVDLGEHLRATVMSVSLGHDLIGKYPLVFRQAALLLLTKCDLLPHTDFSLQAATELLRRISPDAEIICTAARRRIGIDRTAGWLLGYVRAQRFVGWRLERTSAAVHLPV